MRNRRRSIAHHTLSATVVILAAAAMVAGQQPESGVDSRPINVELDPIACWWRTSVAAVRVGEPFSIVLTCAVVENALTSVVPDQSEIEPAALQLPPFDTLGGTDSASVATGTPFFHTSIGASHPGQRLRHRCRLPQWRSNIGYERARLTAPRWTAVSTVLMPPLSIRVLSLVGMTRLISGRHRRHICGRGCAIVSR